jgi:WD40 repeat protein
MGISNLSDETRIQILKEHSKYVVGVRFSPDGYYLASVSHDKTVNLYRRGDDPR